MIQLVDTGKRNTLGVRITGDVTQGDIDRAIRAITRSVNEEDDLHIFVELLSMDSLAINNVLEATGFCLPEDYKFIKKAVITERSWHNEVSNWLNIIFPSITIKYFDAGEYTRALDWLGQD